MRSRARACVRACVCVCVSVYVCVCVCAPTGFHVLVGGGGINEKHSVCMLPKMLPIMSDY